MVRRAYEAEAHEMDICGKAAKDTGAKAEGWYIPAKPKEGKKEIVLHGIQATVRSSHGSRKGAG